MKLKGKEIRLPYVFVVGNEKGGAGKTTFSMHLIASLLEKKLRVCSIDTDSRQHSLTNYIQNRQVYNSIHQERSKVPVHQHFLITENVKAGNSTVEKDKCVQFERIMSRLQSESEVIVIDTPGSHSEISCLAHSYADTIITPINDSFLDIDVLAKVDPYNLRVISPSIYSQMVWEQKMRKSQRDGSTMDWVVVRNRLSNLDAVNKRNVNYVLEQLATRICFKNVPGFSERVIFRELFLQGITLLDLHKRKSGKSLSLSHVAARQELREFIQHLNLDSIIEATHKPRLYNVN